MAGTAFVSMYAASCKTDDGPAPEFDEITLTGANAAAAPYINLKKTHGLAVSDAVLSKVLTGLDFFLVAESTYATAHPLNITITASNDSYANGLISIVFINANNTSVIKSYFVDYKDAHVFARAKGDLTTNHTRTHLRGGVHGQKNEISKQKSVLSVWSVV